MKRSMLALLLGSAMGIAAPCRAGEATVPPPVTIARADFDGSLSLWVLQILRDRYVWSASVSTEGWGEVDLGLHWNIGRWYFEPLLGVDCLRDDDHLRFDAVPQLYLLTEGKRHLETWYVGFIPFEGDPWVHTMRQIATKKLASASIWIGAQYDGSAQKGIRPFHALGPLVEWEAPTLPSLSLTVQWELGGQPTQFLFVAKKAW